MRSGIACASSSCRVRTCKRRLPGSAAVLSLCRVLTAVAVDADVVETAAWTQGSRHLQAGQFDQPLWAANNVDLLLATVGLAVAVVLLLRWLLTLLLTSYQQTRQVQ